MAKGDRDTIQNSIDYNQNLMQQRQNQLQSQNQQLNNQFQNTYNQFQGNYNQGVNQNLGNYNQGMNWYQQFLGLPTQLNTGQSNTPTGPTYNMPQRVGTEPLPRRMLDESGNVVNETEPPSTGGRVSAQSSQGGQVQTVNTPANTGDSARDAIIGLYNQYGITPGGRGSGFSDLDYWTEVAHSSGDLNYILGRLEANIQGHGPDTGGGSGGNYGVTGAASHLPFGQWQNFAETGGFTPQDIQNLRERSMATVRGVYGRSQANIDRQRALQNGYSPNYTAASARLARDEAAQLADTTTNTNAAIAQMVQQGRLAGLTGLTGAQLGGLSSNLQGAQGLTNLYGTSPALAQTFGNQVLGQGNQVLGASGQGINLGNQQNDIANIILRYQLGQAALPSNFQQGLGNAGGILGLLGGIGNLFGGGNPFSFGGGGGSNLPSNPSNSIGTLPGVSPGYDPYDPYGNGGPGGIPDASSPNPYPGPPPGSTTGDPGLPGGSSGPFALPPRYNANRYY